MNRLVLSLALSLFAAPLHANLVLKLDVHHQSKPQQGVQKVGEDAKDASLAVTLAPDWYSIDDGTARAIFDFAKRRIYRSGEKGYDETSLFSYVAGREVELDNRIFLGRAMEAAKTNQHLFALPLQEHELSLQKAGSAATKFEAATKNGEQVRSWKKQELLAWSEERYDATPAERAAFVRFLRYHFGGHPALLADLQKGDGIPKRVRLTTGMVNTVTTIAVAEPRRTDDGPYPALTGTRTPHTTDAMAPALATALATTPASARAAKQKQLADAKRLAEADHALAFLLSGIETNLMFGGDFPSELMPLLAKVRAHPDIAAFTTAVSPRSADEAKAALETLTRLQKVAAEKAYVLRIFHGNHSQNLGDSETAADDYRAALIANPLITGLWKDYGMMLLSSYQAEAAWQCFDAARAIAPSHALVEDVDRLEARLLKDHPEYF